MSKKVEKLEIENCRIMLLKNEIYDIKYNNVIIDSVK